MLRLIIVATLETQRHIDYEAILDLALSRGSGEKINIHQSCLPLSALW